MLWLSHILNTCYQLIPYWDHMGEPRLGCSMSSCLLASQPGLLPMSAIDQGFKLRVPNTATATKTEALGRCVHWEGQEGKEDHAHTQVYLMLLLLSRFWLTDLAFQETEISENRGAKLVWPPGLDPDCEIPCRKDLNPPASAGWMPLDVNAAITRSLLPIHIFDGTSMDFGGGPHSYLHLQVLHKPNGPDSVGCTWGPCFTPLL